MNKKILAIITFILCIFSCNMNIAHAHVYNDIAEAYDVSFRDNNGKNTQKLFSKYDTMVCYSPNDPLVSDTHITLPKTPRIKGYQSLGWTTVKNGKKTQFKSGDKVNITQHTRFYLVKRKSKTFTVKFFPKNGKYSREYKKLTKKIQEDTFLQLPKLPGNKNNSKLYKYVGWSLNKNQGKAKYSPKTKIRIRKNMTFYASWTKR